MSVLQGLFLQYFLLLTVTQQRCVVKVRLFNEIKYISDLTIYARHVITFVQFMTMRAAGEGNETSP